MTEWPEGVAHRTDAERWMLLVISKVAHRMDPPTPVVEFFATPELALEAAELEIVHFRNLRTPTWSTPRGLFGIMRHETELGDVWWIYPIPSPDA